MVTSLVNLFSSVLTPKQVVNKTAQPIAKSNNPFANPFMGATMTKQEFYGKNNPVQGGYFAGYYNGQPNIVGKHLFIEV